MPLELFCALLVLLWAIVLAGLRWLFLTFNYNDKVKRKYYEKRRRRKLS